MALTKIPIELSSTPSIVDGGNATAITIDSNEGVAFSKDISTSTAGTSNFRAGVNAGNSITSGVIIMLSWAIMQVLRLLLVTKILL